MKYSKVQTAEPASVAAVAAATAAHPVSIDIIDAQRDDPEVQDLILQLAEGQPVSASFAKVRSQLVDHGILYRSVKLLLDGVVRVPVVQAALIDQVLQAVHDVSGHGSWQTMYTMIRSQCYFPGIASTCAEFVTQCTRCAAANHTASPSAPPTRSDIPGRPWGEVVLDTLKLGPDRSTRYCCVLTCVDVFTK